MFSKGFCLISYKTFQVDSLCRRCWSRALMTSSRLWIFNRCIFHIISTLLSNKYICQVFDDTKTSRFLDFNRLPSNIIKRGCLAAPIKKFFNLEVVTIMIEMTALIIKRKMKDGKHFKLTKTSSWWLIWPHWLTKERWEMTKWLHFDDKTHQTSRLGLLPSSAA